MKRVFAALFGTVTGLVVLLNFKTHSPGTASAAAIAPAATAPADTSGGSAAPEPATGAAASGSTASGSTASGSTGSGSTSAASSAANTGTSTAKKAYTGDSIDTRWGPVQVKITVAGGKVTSAQAIVYPTENPRDQEINSYAVPTLNQEAVTAGSAKIDMVSGATYTSDGYIQSLQSALDKAGL